MYEQEFKQIFSYAETKTDEIEILLSAAKSFTVKINPPQETQIDPPSLELDAGPADTSEQKIPDWVKNTMQWYLDGAISEDEMISAIQFLVNAGIIKLE